MLPTREQEFLLKAALLSGETARQAWHNWRTQVDFEHDIDPGSFRLLPLLYHNLYALNVKDPLMGRLKGIYHREWSKNQLLFHTTANILRMFQAAGIETLILKGAALTQLYYKNYGLRPMYDFDILVPTAKQQVAIDLLAHAGWKPELVSLDRLTANVSAMRHSWNFIDSNKRGLDLHWHALIECRGPQADDDFWAGSIPCQIDDVSTRALNPTDQLLHVCVHGTGWNLTPPMRWIADALTVLRVAAPQIEWPRLIAQAEKRRLSLSLHYALSYLHTSFEAAIPAEVLTHLSQVYISAAEQKLFTAITTKPSLLGGLPQLWYRHLFDLDAIGKTNWLQKLASFPRYLRGYKATDRQHLLTWAISRPIVRISQAVRRLI